VGGKLAAGLVRLTVAQERVPHRANEIFSFPHCFLDTALRSTMAKTQSESSDDFEFIETPAAPIPVPPSEDCGVRTTSVSWYTITLLALF
jgi:hypothetical protein